MLFTTFSFGLFFLVFFAVYWTLAPGGSKAQNIALLAGSCFFYAWWNWKFLLLVLASAAACQLSGLQIAKNESPRKKAIWLYTGMLLVLGTLFLFKYYDFFAESLQTALAAIHIKTQISSLGLILPLGISFYSFRLVGYLLDIYYGKSQPVTQSIIFFNYVLFFPSIISGPIDRANLLIPQLAQARRFEKELAVDGLRQGLWGWFKKAAISNAIAPLVAEAFDHYQSHSGSALLIAAFLYAFQLYADFSGYTDMAIGIAKLLGIRIARNFDYPFFSQNIAEFWRKWNMSLTSWFTDYLFTPLSMSFRAWGNAGLILAVLINFTIIGIWHGPSWTFILFGLLHGCYMIPLILQGRLQKKKKRSPQQKGPKPREIANMIGTFILVTLTWILFRSDNFIQARGYFLKIFGKTLFHKPDVHVPPYLWALIVFLIIADWLGKDREYPIASLPFKRPIRWAFYYCLLLGIFYLSGHEEQFIYFHF